MRGCLRVWSRTGLGLARLAVVAAVLLVPALAAAQTGTVTGTVRNAATGLPIAGVEVFILTPRFEVVSSGATNGTGFFSIAGVPVGSYLAGAFPLSSTGLLAQLFPDTNLGDSLYSIDLFDATPFVVTSGGTTSNRNFNLVAAGRVSGTVTNAAGGAALENVGIFLYQQIGSFLLGMDSASTDASGNYEVSGLRPGTYYAVTSNDLGFVEEAYDNVRCVASCSDAEMLRGIPIVVAAGTTVAGRNFALDTGGRVTGTVTNAATGAPLQGVTVTVSTAVGNSSFTVGSDATDATGTYTVIGLAAGTYFAHTSNTLGFMNEVHNDVLCPLNCFSSTAVSSGAGLTVALGQTTPGVNFALNQGGNISGTVINQTTAAPINGVGVTAVVRVGSSTHTAFASTNAAGNYTITGLPTGAYRLFTSTFSGFIAEIYDNQQCRGSCNSTTAATIGSPVAVTAGATTTGNNFALQPSGSITGTIIDSASGQPISSVGVQAFAVVDGVLTQVGNASTGSTGVYTVQGLHTGSHFIATSGNPGWRNEVYDNLPCLGNPCASSLVATGTAVPVVVGNTTAGRNFALDRGDLVQGRITDSSTGNPIALANVTLVHSPSGTQAGTGQTGPNGGFIIQGVPNGTYVAFTSNAPGYFNEIFNDIRCTTACSSATALAVGTPITVTAAGAAHDGADELVLSRNFALDPRNDAPGAPTNFRATVANGTAQFSWAAPSTNNAGIATSFVIDAGVSPGGTIVSIPATGTSHTVSGVPPGVFYVRVRAINAAGSSPPSNEVTLVIGGGSTALPEAPTGLAAFMSGTRLTMTWAAATSGGPASSFLVEAGSASGAANIAALPVSGRSFTFVPVPNGFYFLRVRAANAAGVSPPSSEVMIVVGNVASPPGAPNFTSHAVTGSTVTLNWLAPSVGTATSYTIEAGSATGLANLAMFNTGNTNVTASFTGVSPGTYFVRVRGVNGLGASVVSNERTVVVP